MQQNAQSSNLARNVYLFRVTRSSLKGIQVVVDEGAPPECQGKM
jgi:hypothetical protein